LAARIVVETFDSEPVREVSVIRQFVQILAGALLLAAVASNAAERIDIISEGGADKYWTPPKDPLVPAYPAIVTENDQVCVGVGYMIESDGSTSGFVVLKSWSRTHGQGDNAAKAIEPFARNALAAVQQWKFEPAAPGKPRRVFTARTFAFDRDAQADGAATRERCTVSNLKAFIAKAQADAYRTGNLKKGEMERDRAQNPPVIPAKSGSID
jgi:hypothetical protein